MIKATIDATLDKYEIKCTEAGKKAKITLLTRLDTSEEIYKLGIDPVVFLVSDTTVKSQEFQNLPVLIEGFKIELWSAEEKESSRLATYLFSNLILDKVKVVMEPIDGKDAALVAIAHLVFTVRVDSDLNQWLFSNVMEFVAVRFTQKAEQQMLDLAKEAKKMGVTGVEIKNGKEIIHCDVDKMDEAA